MPVFHMPLPPSLNHAYDNAKAFSRRTGRAYTRRVKGKALVRWELAAQAAVGGWKAPARTPLAMTITYYLPANVINTLDLDGLEKFVIDQSVGKNRDQWVYRKVSAKRPIAGSEGWVVVEVTPLPSGQFATL